MSSGEYGESAELVFSCHCLTSRHSCLFLSFGPEDQKAAYLQIAFDDSYLLWKVGFTCVSGQNRVYCEAATSHG